MTILLLILLLVLVPLAYYRGKQAAVRINSRDGRVIEGTWEIQ